MYRFRINPSTDNVVFSPANKVDLTKTNKKERNGNGAWYYEYSLGELIVNAKTSKSAYDYLIGLVQDELDSEEGNCAEHYLVVEKLKNHSWIVQYQGAFSIRDCEVDYNKCYVKFKTEVVDDYRCFLGNTDTDFNILTIPETVTLSSSLGLDFNIGFVFTFQKDSFPRIAPTTPAPYTGVYWFVDDQQFNDYVGTDDYYLNLWGYIWELTDCINGVPQPPTGNGDGTQWINWTEVTTGNECNPNGTTEWRLSMFANPGFNNYAQIGGFSLAAPASVAINSLLSKNTAGVYGPPTAYGVQYLGNPSVSLSFDNGVKLLDVIQRLVQNACPSIEFIQSTFFTALVNPVTNGPNYWRNPVLYQITDIKTPDSDENASRCFVTFDKLMGDLNKMFDLWWRIEDGLFILEHESYFSGVAPTDLSDIKGFERFTFIKDTMEGSREFVSRAQNNIDFVGMDIVYQRPCVNTERKTINLELLCADIDFIRSHPDDTPNDAVVIVARDGGVMIEQIGLIGGVLAANAPMSWANIHPNFHRHNANTLNGTINGSEGDVDETTFIQTVPTRESNIIVADCDVVIDEKKPIKTLLGVGQIDQLKINLQTGVSEIKYSL